MSRYYISNGEQSTCVIRDVGDLLYMFDTGAITCSEYTHAMFVESHLVRLVDFDTVQELRECHPEHLI